MQRFREDRGQATVEFALVLPVLAMCVAGVIWVGNIALQQVRLEHAAREGARAAAIAPDNAHGNAASAVRRSVPEGRVHAAVESEFVIVTVDVEIRGLPLIGVGRRVLRAEAHFRREDIIDR